MLEQRKTIKFIKLIMALLSLGFIVFIAYILTMQIIKELGSLNPNIIAAIVAALAALFGVLYNQRENKLKDIQESHRPEKVKLYKEFMDFTVKILINSKHNKLQKMDNEIEKFFLILQKN